MRSKGTPKKGIDGGSSGGGKSEAKSPAPRGHGPLVACEVVEDWGRALERPSRDSVWFPKGCFSPRAPGEGRAPPWASPPRTKRMKPFAKDGIAKRAVNPAFFIIIKTIIVTNLEIIVTNLDQQRSTIRGQTA